MAIGDSPPVPPPRAQYTEVARGIGAIAPLTKTASGPGLIVIVDESSSGASIRHCIPSPSQKWAEEGFHVVEVRSEIVHSSHADASSVLQKATEALRHTLAREEKNGLGLICYDATAWDHFAPHVHQIKDITCAVVFGAASTALSSLESIPILAHIAGSQKQQKAAAAPSKNVKAYTYADQHHSFGLAFSDHFDYAAEAIAHTRNLSFLKRHLGGPYFDLEQIWDEHTYYEFEVRDVEKTMNTMVQEPYVNHIPTITGGIGRDALTDFYTHHFVFANPADAELELVSRTIGIDRVVDEFIFKLTHDKEVDWLYPGLPPTHTHVEIPMLAIVCIRGDRLYHEHIHWDHASALKQIGYLPATAATSNNNHEYPLPVAGREGAAKLRNKNCGPSNAMFEHLLSRGGTVGNGHANGNGK